jgi:glycosyltransferase involved in cell wall biosynthesis
VTATAPFVSIVIPCRNEAGYIRAFLDSALATTYPSDRYELLVVDGMSEDGTRAIVEEYAGAHPQVQLLDNPRRITPCALNLGIARAQGAIIIRMDAHADYPATYVGDLVDWLERTGADNVGASWDTCPADGSVMAGAIAAVMAHRFGIGNAQYRLGTDRPRDVDTVPFGCYRREVFQRIGVFDEELVRNQDDEFNFRLLRAGGRIVLVPGVVCRYYARRSLRQVARMFYQYGFFKPLVAWKIGKVMTLRQIVPALFVLSLLIAGLTAPVFVLGRIAFAAVLGAYLAVDCACAIGLKSLTAAAVFPVVHLSYGWGFLRGSWALLARMRGQSLDLSSTPLTR